MSYSSIFLEKALFLLDYMLPALFDLNIEDIEENKYRNLQMCRSTFLESAVREGSSS